MKVVTRYLENALCSSGRSVDLSLMISREDVDVVLNRHVGALLFWMTSFNHLSPVMKCDCYSKVLASTFDSISVPLQIPLDCVDSWEKHFSCKFATCDAGIMAGWLGV